MTYLNCACSKNKIFAAGFWFAAICVAFIVNAPMFIIPLAIVGMLHGTYLMLNPIPLPIMLSFLSMLSLSLYVLYINASPLA